MPAKIVLASGYRFPDTKLRYLGGPIQASWQEALKYFSCYPQNPTRTVAFDFETTGVHLFHESAPFMLCATANDGECWTWKGTVDPLTRRTYWSKEDQEEISDFFQHSDWQYVATNKKFDVRCLAKVAEVDPYELLLRTHETLGMHHVFNNKESHALKDAAVKYAKIPDKDEKKLLDAVRSAKTLAISVGLDWAFASKITCPQQTKAPSGAGGKGWAVMDYWLPEAVAEYMWQTSEAWTILGNLLEWSEEDKKSGAFKARLLVAQRAMGWEWRPPSCYWIGHHEWWVLCQEYCAYDTLRSLLLFDGFKASLEADYTWDPISGEKINCWDVYLQNAPAFAISYITEEAGLTFNPEACSAEIDRLSFELEDAAEAVSLSLSPFVKFNPSSPDQIRNVIYGMFKIPVTRRTKPSKKKKKDGSESWGGGNPTTDEDFIVQLLGIFSPEDPGLYRPPVYQRGVEKYMAYRIRLMQWHTLVTTNGEPIQLFAFLLSMIHWKKVNSTITKLKGYVHAGLASRLHPSLNPIGAKTPRYSSSNPNAQNISKGGKGKLPDNLLKAYPSLRQNLRGYFGPLAGREWWSIDYSQLQLVIAAAICKSERMLDLVAKGMDFHTAMGRFVFPDADEMSSIERTIVKNVNFGFWFGAGPEKVELTCGRPGMYDKLANLFPEAIENIDRMSWQVRREGFVTTLGGYRLYVPEDAEYAGCVYAVQGTEGVLVKRATYQAQHFLETSPSLWTDSGQRFVEAVPTGFPKQLRGRTNGRRAKDDIHFNLFLHDELDFDAIAGRGYAYIPTVTSIMESAALSLGVPAKAVAKFHPIDWGHSLKEEQI